MQDEESEFVEHRPCPSCGSSDGLGIYSDGHGYCFSCDTFFSASEQDKNSSTILEDSKNSRRNSRNNKGRRPDFQSSLRDRKTCDLLARGILKATCRDYGYGVARVVSHPRIPEGALVHYAPYFDPLSGEEVAAKLRTRDKDFSFIGDPKRAGLFGVNICQGKGRRVVIAEGELDCLSVYQALGSRWPVLSLANGADKTGKGVARELAKNLEFLNKFDEIVLCFDMDEPGRKSAQAAAAVLPPGKVSIVQLPPGYKDANEMVVANKSNDLRSAVWNAKRWQPDGIVCLGDDEVLEAICKETSVGVSYPWPRVTQMTLGFQPGQMHVIGAGSGTGKSIVCAEIAYHWRRLGKKVGYLAFEENFGMTGKRLVGLALKKPIYLPGTNVPPEVAREVAKELAGESGDGFVFTKNFGSLEPDDFLMRLRHMWAVNGVEGFIVDHLSILFSGNDTTDERKYIDRLVTKLRMFTEETNTFAVVVTHLSRRKNSPFELGGQVTSSDARGSGSIEQLSDVFIGLERNQQAETQEERDQLSLRVVKVRLGGRTGIADVLQYNPETGRLSTALEEWDANDDREEEEEQDDQSFVHASCGPSVDNEDFEG